MHTHVWVCTWGTHMWTHIIYPPNTHGQRAPNPHMHAGAHTYPPPTQMHTHTPICMYTHARTYTCTHTHNMHTHTPYKLTHTHMHTLTFEHTGIRGLSGHSRCGRRSPFTHHLCPQRHLPRQSILCPQPSHILGTPVPVVLHSTLQVLPKPAHLEASAAPPTPVFKPPGCPIAHSK